MATQNQVFSFTFQIRRLDDAKVFQLPDLKYQGLFPIYLNVASNSKDNKIQIIGLKDQKIEYTPAILAVTNSFSLVEYQYSIISAKDIKISVKNLVSNDTVDVRLDITYGTYPPQLLNNNVFPIQPKEHKTSKEIIEYIRTSGKYVTQVVFTATDPLQYRYLSGIQMVPICESQPAVYQPIEFTVSGENQSTWAVQSQSEIEDLAYYYINFPNDLSTIGVVVYGYL